MSAVKSYSLAQCRGRGKTWLVNAVEHVEDCGESFRSSVMIGCGISISGNEAVFVWVDLASGAVLQDAKAKVKLSDPYAQDDVVQTFDLIRQLIAERKTDLVVVRKSSTSGKFPALHTAFRIEALIAISSPVQGKFIAPQAIASFIKKNAPKIPEVVLVYQKDAYLALISGLGE